MTTSCEGKKLNYCWLRSALNAMPKEKEALESLKMRLESEKRRVEDALEAERSLALDKDMLLKRSKDRERDLEEEVGLLKLDIDTLESQLNRALRMQHESEESHKALRAAFGQAAEHLVNLESEQQERASRETELSTQLGKAEQEIETLQREQDELVKEKFDLNELTKQHREDLDRAKERLDAAIRDREEKLSVESRNRDLAKSRADNLEHDARQAKEQLAELTRTAADYSQMIERKEADILRVKADLDASKAERSHLSKEVIDLKV
ncbi:hypothetical protein FA95DRAFT_1652369 [Auriscalpium vulgare]|uniref:Uncharacterized protein n=1 Tax=Auriscalpium vulgare TaxID=40419 RepID=A0ACB8R8R9_9AGAM|nr:hypothetical protein FA95DRAFT_1652369 [Auriscalpium vulgare]